MYRAWNKIVFLLLACYWLGVISAPHNQADEETDPELIAGYFQGDMDVTFQRTGLLAPTRQWPNATVYYKIDPEFDEPHAKHIVKAMKLIENVSCIRFIPAAEEDLNYVLISVSPLGCFSNVGYLGGEQNLGLTNNKLGTVCFRLGVIQHELLHTLGFFHQHSAPDRDEYVKILEENIIEGKEQAFKKLEADRVSDYGAPYDYSSILHYAPYGFSNNGEPTIVALDPEGQSKMGQRAALSQADVVRINNMYKCSLEI